MKIRVMDVCKVTNQKRKEHVWNGHFAFKTKCQILVIMQKEGIY